MLPRLSVSKSAGSTVHCEVCGLRVTASPGLARHQSNALVCSTRASARNQAGYFRARGFEYVHPGWATEAAMALLREHGVEARVCAAYLRCAIACHKDPTVARAFDSALKMDAGLQFILQYAAPDAAHALAEGKGEAP